MMDGPYVLGHATGRQQIGRTFQANGERMQPGPPGCHAIILIHTLGAEFGCDRGHNGRIDTAGNEHAVGNITHKLPVNGGFQSRS